jgi:hypothetical protein
MRLVRSGFKRSIQYIIVYSEGHLTKLIKAVLDLIREVVHESVDDCEEDGVD